MNSQEIGKRLREIRTKQGFTIRTTAALLDMSEQSWGSIERGKRMISLKSLSMFAHFFNVSADYILYGENSNNILDIERDSFFTFLSELNQEDLTTISNILKVYHQSEKERREKNEYFDPKLFAKRIRAYREKCKISIEELARRSGIHRSYLERIELSNAAPTIETVDKILKVLNMPLDNALADSIPAGKTVILKDIFTSYQEFTSEQRKIAKATIEGYLNGIKNI